MNVETDRQGLVESLTDKETNITSRTQELSLKENCVNINLRGNNMVMLSSHFNSTAHKWAKNQVQSLQVQWATDQISSVRTGVCFFTSSNRGKRLQQVAWQQHGSSRSSAAPFVTSGALVCWFPESLTYNLLFNMLVHDLQYNWNLWWKPASYKIYQSVLNKGWPGTCRGWIIVEKSVWAQRAYST